MNFIARLFRSRKSNEREGTTFDMSRGSGWGNEVVFSNRVVKDTTVTHDVHGWLTPLPKKGDFVLKSMGSGKVGKFQFTEVKPCKDPKDMFFGKVVGIGYV